MKKSSGISEIVIEFKDWSELPPFERETRQRAWNAFWKDLIIKAQKQVEEDRRNGIKHIYPTKLERLIHIEKIAAQLNIKIPKVVKGLSYVDICSIEREMKHALYIEQQKQNGCDIVYVPPRLPISEIIERVIKQSHCKKSHLTTNNTSR